MVDLVSLAEVRNKLRIGEPIDEGESPIPPHEDDGILQSLYIPAASKAVIRYLKAQAEVVIPGLADSPQSADGCPEDVKFAVIALVGILYDGGADDDARKFEQGYLPPLVTSMLYPLRDPALA